ncbi:MAG: methyltransferase, partial [Prevotella sp.]|nr:methyltransferase [Prevotella sp.]
MSNTYFEFKRFTVHQERCGMKVGTDGCLLGAWAVMPPAERCSPHILDVGTGTGLIALMMAQRYPEARVTAVEIDAEAAGQAQENVLQSPFASRIEV